MKKMMLKSLSIIWLFDVDIACVRVVGKYNKECTRVDRLVILILLG